PAAISLNKGLFRQALALFSFIVRLAWRHAYLQATGSRCSWHSTGSISMDRYYLLILLFSGIVLTNQAAAIERDDTRRLQQQRIERQAFDQERGLLQEAEVEASGKTPGLRADEQTYAVERNASDLGQALYLSLQYHQWPAAQSFLAEYVQLPDQDPLLVHYAQGAL